MLREVIDINLLKIDATINKKVGNVNKYIRYTIVNSEQKYTLIAILSSLND